jgi:hypothetical protein
MNIKTGIFSLNKQHSTKGPWLFFLPLILFFLAIACSSPLGANDYMESFNRAGNWGIGDRTDLEGKVENGVYEMLVKSSYGIYYAFAGEDFTDGIYEVEATQIDGPINNGYGMLFRLDETTDSFYAFEISGDGFVWIGRCHNLCNDEAVTLVGGDWFRSPAVKTGLQATNHLQVVVNGNRMTFYVNSVEVGRTADTTFTNGDIALAVETLGERNVRIVFDNFNVSPLND